MKRKKIVIIGAGPGGLTAGMILSKYFDVEIFEKEKTPGGRNAALKLGNFTFDTGPTFLMMKFVLDEAFKAAGRKSEDYLKFTDLSPMYRLQFSDDHVDIYRDHKKTEKEMRKVFGDDAEGLKEFLKKEKERYDKIFPILKKDYSSWKSFLDHKFIKGLPYLALWTSVYNIMGKYFKEENARLCFTFQSKYLGMAPWDCPGAFSIIPYVEHAFGIYHVEGGLCMISEAMSKVIKEKKGKITYGTPVKELIIEGKKVRGVRLESGKEVFADSVIINADFAYAMSSLVPKGSLKKYSKEKLKKKKYSCSTFMIYLGLKKKYDLKHHTIVFADIYKKNISDIFKGKLSEEVSFYVQNASLNDKTLAPKGKSAIYILVPVANKKADIDWKKETPKVRKAVMERLKDRLGMDDIEKNIEKEKIITPDDWEKDYNVFLGATFNLAHSSDQMTLFRPHNRFEELENCYLVGGGTHPGSGLPTIYESGMITSRLLKEDLK